MPIIIKDLSAHGSKKENSTKSLGRRGQETYRAPKFVSLDKGFYKKLYS